MHFAFGIVKLFPGGGLQRDCVEIARQLLLSGHDVTIFTSSLDDGEFARGLNIRLLPNNLRTNHAKQTRFSDDFNVAQCGQFDLSLGFDKLAGLDVLYCADPSILRRVKKNWYLYLRPRYRALIELERQSFARGSRTSILLQDAHQLEGYQKAWRTELGRIALVAPTIAQDRQRPELRRDGTRERVRRRLGLTDADWAWITIQVQPRTKGLDRTLRALQRFPKARLLIVGLSAGDRTARHCVRLARGLGVEQQVQWAGHREDIPELLSAADILIHPARYDTTGSVILEAILNELPVITTEACGYARHLVISKSGIVLPEPFDFQQLLAELHPLQAELTRQNLAKQARIYGQHQRFNLGKTHVANMIIMLAEDRKNPTAAFTPGGRASHGLVGAGGRSLGERSSGEVESHV
jgi:UDP-glucose:(heptosyl)LPS alpha-1,3-glucosyltransferase